MNKLVQLYKRLPLTVLIRLFVVRLVHKMAKIGYQSYSQTGEDIIISQMIGKRTGFYLDVGCNHPITLSNTFKFYLLGWRGISIDANQYFIDLHKSIRPLDIAVCAAVSNEIKEVTFYKSKTPAVSTIDSETFEVWKNTWEFNPKEMVKVETTTLNQLLKNNLPSNQTIDLLTIDVEGHELQVLEGLDLNTYKPQLIVVEIHDLDMSKVADNKVCKYLLDRGYEFKNYATMNAYFLRIP